MLQLVAAMSAVQAEAADEIAGLKRQLADVLKIVGKSSSGGMVLYIGVNAVPCVH